MEKRVSKPNRMEKVNSEIKKNVYEIITRRLKNPLITEMISIVDVDTSKDLSHAKIFLSVFSVNEEKKKQTFEAIKSESKRIRFELSKSMRARTVPEVHFYLDGSMEYGDKMDKLFLEIKKTENNVD